MPEIPDQALYIFLGCAVGMMGALWWAFRLPKISDRTFLGILASGFVLGGAVVSLVLLVTGNFPLPKPVQDESTDTRLVLLATLHQQGIYPEQEQEAELSDAQADNRRVTGGLIIGGLAIIFLGWLLAPTPKQEKPR